ncbi:MAG: pantetheine-phosphate adenylyltransferase [Planctomycetes bacterium]|nr:pantetheine-phosphate adenylyltransferase [Planctomycetota bacterium]
MAKTRPAPAKHALFPGTFDPVTLGHVDLVRRAARVFERVTLAVATHPTKTGLLSVDERLVLLRDASSDLPNVDVVRLEGLVVDGCKSLGAGVILRGLRDGADVEYELQMARSNRAMAPEIETVLLAASPEHAHISSTLVRQIAALGGDLAPFVPKSVLTLLRKRRARPQGS